MQTSDHALRAGAFYFVLCFLVIIPMLATTSIAGAQPRVKVLILTGESDYPYHDWRSTTPFLRDLLEQTGRFDVKVAEETRGLDSRSLAPYTLLVLNYNGPRWGDVTEKAVEEHVRGGKGMVAVHGVSYGTFFGMEYRNGRWVYPNRDSTGWIAYPELLGASWKPENIGHAARHAFTAKWIDRSHPICGDLPESFMISDELYHRMDLRPEAKVLASAYDDPKRGGTGKEEPLLWTVAFGKGRVVHTTLGHDTMAMYAEGFRSAFVRSAEWAGTGSVTLPAKPAATAVKPVRVLAVSGGHDYSVSFYALFEGQQEIAWSHATSQTSAFTPKLKDLFDAIVLYDMHEQIGPNEQANLKAFVESGKGIVSIHHAIVDYTSWPWWYEEVIGGKFFTEASGLHDKSEYKEGVDFVVNPAKGAGAHPVMRGVGPLVVHDETYRKMWHSEKITVLMETDEPSNDRAVIYVGPHPKARAVFIQLGHGDSTLRNPGFHRLVRNAILWSARRLE